MNRNRIVALAGAGALLAALVIGGIAIAGGGDGDEAAATTTAAPETTTTAAPEATTTAAPETTTTAAPETTTTTTTLPEIFRQPLTGEVVGSEEEKVDRAALVVKIDNAPGARRNHTGLAVADIVFEEIVEGSITRFAAIFHTEGSDPVGPIRSGRTQDVDLLTSFNSPLFAWSGGNAAVTTAIANSFLTDLNAQRTPGYYRGPGSSPHNLYSDTDTLWALTPPDHPGPPVQQYTYLRPDESFEGGPATRIDVQMRGISVDWDWNAELGVFERSQAGAPHMDKTHGRIGATNVVVIGTDYRPSPADARSPEAITVGSGPVYVFSDGKFVAGRWQRNNAVFPLEFVDDDGEPIALRPGNTWIELNERIPNQHVETRGIEMQITP